METISTLTLIVVTPAAGLGLYLQFSQHALCRNWKLSTFCYPGSFKTCVDFLQSNLILTFRPDLDVNCSDRYGVNALMYATKDAENIDIVRLLLERKDLDLDEKDIDGKTAEDFATEIQNTRAVEMIREERRRRMGKVWTKEVSEEEEDESELEERTSTPELEEVEEPGSDTQSDGKIGVNVLEERQNDLLKCQLTENLRERLEKEKFLLQNHEHMHEINLGKLLSEKQKEEEILKQKLKEVEEKYTSSKEKLEADFLSTQSSSQSLIAKLEGLIANMDLERLLSLNTEPRPCSELECPVCLVMMFMNYDNDDENDNDDDNICINIRRRCGLQSGSGNVSPVTPCVTSVSGDHDDDNDDHALMISALSGILG